MREVELKYQVADVEALLAALRAHGVALGPAVDQDDQAYAPAGWTPGQDRSGVPFARLRTEDRSRHLLAIKVLVGQELDCREHETVVDNREEMHAALLAMGHQPTARVRKRRRSGWWGDVYVCVDEVHGLAGVFLELERIVSIGESGGHVQAELARHATTLGVPLERVDATYDALLREVAR